MKVRITIDQGFCFYPEHDGSHYTLVNQKPKIDIPSELVEKFEKIRNEYMKINSIMEELYRKQEGLEFDDSALQGIDVTLIKE